MSEENKIKNSEAEPEDSSAENDNADYNNTDNVSGYFDSLISDEDFSDTDENTAPVKMKDFSEFFNDAAASGQGFKSTIDSKEIPEAIDTDNAEIIRFKAAEISNNLEKNSDGSHKEDNAKEKADTEMNASSGPVTDEDGMIVLFDAEAGIDAISEIIEEASDKFDKKAAEKAVADEKKAASPKKVSVKPKSNKNGSSAKKTTVQEIVVFDEESDKNSTSPEENNKPSVTEEPKDEKQPFIQTIIPWKGDSFPEVIRKIVFIGSSAVFLTAGGMLISTLIQSEEAVEQLNDIKEVVTTTVAISINEQGETVTIAPTYEERVEHNFDVMEYFTGISENVVGYIEIAGCDLFYPVVQGTDNVYYLTHTFDDKVNKAGSIFMDYRCTLSEDYRSPNIVLYGHNQEDRTMFGNLKLYKENVEFYKNNPIITFNSRYDIGSYVIFGYFVTNALESQDSNGEVFHYQDYIETMADEPTFNWYMEQVAIRNQIITPVDVAYGDKLLVLSTCSSEYTNSRFVVIARALREDEEAETLDLSTARLNPNAKLIDWEAILSESTSETESDISTTPTEETTVPDTEETTTVPTTEETTTVPESVTEETTAPEDTEVSDDTSSETTTTTRRANNINIIR
ncbi:MAG: sortase domain-bontaining protein [Huintestinicola sp.]